MSGCDCMACLESLQMVIVQSWHQVLPFSVTFLDTVNPEPLGTVKTLALDAVAPNTCSPTPLSSHSSTASLCSPHVQPPAPHVSHSAIHALCVSMQYLLQAVVERVFSGPLVTSLDMAGVSLTLLRVEQAGGDEVLRLLDHPVGAPGWAQVGVMKVNPDADKPVAVPGAVALCSVGEGGEGRRPVAVPGEVALGLWGRWGRGGGVGGQGWAQVGVTRVNPDADKPVAVPGEVALGVWGRGGRGGGRGAGGRARGGGQGGVQGLWDRGGEARGMPRGVSRLIQVKCWCQCRVGRAGSAG